MSPNQGGYRTMDGVWFVDIVELRNIAQPRHYSDPRYNGVQLRVRKMTPHGLISEGYVPDVPSLAKYFDPAELVKV